MVSKQIIVISLAVTVLAACGGGSSPAPAPQIIIPPPVTMPVAFDIAEMTNVNEVLNAMLNAQDPNGDALTYSVTSQPTIGNVSVTDASTGAFQYTPNQDEFGTDQFRYRVNDGSNNSPEGVVTVVINRPPVAQQFSARAATSQPKSETLPGNDDDGDSITFEIVTQPADGTISNLDINTGDFTYQANASFEGGDSFTYKLNDGFADSNTATVDILVDAWTGTVNLGSAAEEVVFYGVEIDSQRNVYIAHSTDGAIAGATAGGGLDFVLTKLDSSGNVVWQTQWGVAGNEFPYQLVMGPNNRLYLTIHDRSDPGVTPHQVWRFDLDGNLDWSVVIPDPDIYSNLYRMDVAPSGNAYITLRGGGRAGLAKVNDNGTLGFVKHVGSEVENPTDPLHTGPFNQYDLQIRGIVVDANELVWAFINAYYEPTATGTLVENAMLATFDSNGTIQTRLEPLAFASFPTGDPRPAMGHVQFTAGGNLRLMGWQGADVAVSEFDTGGNEIYTTGVLAGGVDIVRLGYRGDLMADGSSIVSGSIFPEPQVSDDEEDVHVNRFDNNGTLVWERIIDATPSSGAPLRHDCCGQPKVDVNGDIIFAVTSNGTHGTMPNQGGNDVFVMKLDGATGEIIESN